MKQKEIAKQANVSVSTVSRVISGKYPSAASPEVQERILRIAKSSGYSPAFAMQDPNDGLRGPEAGMGENIVVLFAGGASALSDPYFALLVKSIEEAAAGTGHAIRYLCLSPNAQESGLLRGISAGNPAGVIVLGRCGRGLLETLTEAGVRLICVGLNAFDAGCDQVLCEGAQAACEAVAYLVRLGHRRIGYLGAGKNEARSKGYRAALEANHLPFREELFCETPLTFEGGHAGAKRLLSQSCGLSAVLCANDLAAIGAIRALREEGLCIPEDVSVIGIDDIDAARYLSPALTSVHVPIDEMGSVAWKILLDRIRGGHSLPLKICLPFHIEERESCAGPA